MLSRWRRSSVVFSRRSVVAFPVWRRRGAGGSRSGQLGLPLPGVEPGFIEPSDLASDVLGEYAALGLAPGGQVMDLLRPGLRGVTTADLSGVTERERVAGRVVRPQRSLARAVFLTLED